MTGIPVVALFASIFGALLGVSITYLTMQRNMRKDVSLKLAEHRINWMNSLRDSFCTFHSCAGRLIYFPQDTSNKATTYERYLDFGTRVQMSMNLRDPQYPDLINCMLEYDSLLNETLRTNLPNKKNEARFDDIDERFIVIANQILKREWSRTKSNLYADTLYTAALSKNKFYSTILVEKNTIASAYPS